MTTGEQFPSGEDPIPELLRQIAETMTGGSTASSGENTGAVGPMPESERSEIRNSCIASAFSGCQEAIVGPTRESRVTDQAVFALILAMQFGVRSNDMRTVDESASLLRQAIDARVFWGDSSGTAGRAWLRAAAAGSTAAADLLHEELARIKEQRRNSRSDYFLNNLMWECADLEVPVVDHWIGEYISDPSQAAKLHVKYLCSRMQKTTDDEQRAELAAKAAHHYQGLTDEDALFAATQLLPLINRAEHFLPIFNKYLDVFPQANGTQRKIETSQISAALLEHLERYAPAESEVVGLFATFVDGLNGLDGSQAERLDELSMSSGNVILANGGSPQDIIDHYTTLVAAKSSEASRKGYDMSQKLAADAAHIFGNYVELFAKRGDFDSVRMFIGALDYPGVLVQTVIKCLPLAKTTADRECLVPSEMHQQIYPEHKKLADIIEAVNQNDTERLGTLMMDIVRGKPERHDYEETVKAYLGDSASAYLNERKLSNTQDGLIKFILKTIDQIDPDSNVRFAKQLLAELRGRAPVTFTGRFTPDEGAEGLALSMLIKGGDRDEIAQARQVIAKVSSPSQRSLLAVKLATLLSGDYFYRH